MASYKEMVYNDAVKYIENNIQAIRNDDSNRSLHSRVHDVLRLNPEVTGDVDETPYCDINEAKQYFFDNIKEAMDILMDWAHGDEGCIREIGFWFTGGDWQVLDEVVRREVLSNIIFNIINDLCDKHGPRYFDPDEPAASKEPVAEMDKYTKIVLDYFTNHNDEYLCWFDSAIDLLTEAINYGYDDDDYVYTARSDLAFEMRYYFDNDKLFHFDDMQPLVRELLENAIHDVDFYEIADYFIEIAKKEIDYC